MRDRSSAALIALLFVAARVAVAFARDPFFDEIFTLWMARRPFGAIVPSLLEDSGPPLYYFLARFDSVGVLRAISFLAAAVPFAILLAQKRLVAAALLAVYPPAVLFAVDARPYALCAALVGVGLLIPRSRFIAFLAAAYTHYYGVLFFPLLLLEKENRARRVLLLLALYVPGFVLAYNQPREAIGWMQSDSWFAPLVNLSFAGRYPEALFAPAAWWIVVASAVLLAVVVAKRALTRDALFVFVPLVLAVVAGVYFPMRFESVIAVPLVIWLSGALDGWPQVFRHVLIGALMAIGIGVVANGAIDHLGRPRDGYREAALVASRILPVDGAVYATGYCYLETAVRVPRVRAFPPEQGRHPGWRSTAAGDARTLPPSFYWVVESKAPEVRSVARVYRLEQLFRNDRAIIVRATRR